MVVDPSILHPAVLNPSSSAGQALSTAASLAAPDIYVTEVANAIRNTLLQGIISTRQANESINRLKRLPIVRHASMPLLDRIWQLRNNMTTYDASYVALAERLKMPLLTADSVFTSTPGVRCTVRFVKL